MMDEEDEVVTEIPVHLSKKLAEKLLVLQHNAKFSTPDYIDRSIVTCALKSDCQELMLEVQSDVNAETYSDSKGEEIASKVSYATNTLRKKNKDVSDSLFKSDKMDKHTFTAKKAHMSDKYAIGYLHENELFISPVKGVFKLFPNSSYLDFIDKHEKIKKTQTDANASDEETDSGQAEPEKIKVKFTSNHQDRVKRPVSSSQYAKKLHEESWQYKRWYNSESVESEREKLQFVVTEDLSDVQKENASDDTLLLPLTKKEYLNTLVSTTDEDTHASASTSDRNFTPNEECSVFLLHQNNSLTLLEKCRIIMKRVKIIEFDDVMNILQLKLSQKSELLKAMQQSAFLVRGVWIIKSELLYLKNTYSFESGLSSERMCTIRDFILYLFKTKEYVNRKEVLKVYEDISLSELNDIMFDIAEHIPRRGWKLKITSQKAQSSH